MTVAAILLAAGLGTRFGPENKLLAEVEGVPLIVRAADALSASSIFETIVVVQPNAEKLRSALNDHRVRFVENVNFRNGLGSSVAAGVSALSSESRGALVVPGDMPNLDRDVIARLIAAWNEEGGLKIIVPTTSAGEQRNPVLWPRRFFPELTALNGADGGKPLLARHAAEIRAVEVENSDIFLDIDTPVDIERNFKR